MGTKRNPGLYDCYANAEPDEPIFILLGRDPNAPGAIRLWADARAEAVLIGAKPKTDMRIVEEARECAMQMETYRAERSARPDRPTDDKRVDRNRASVGRRASHRRGRAAAADRT